MLHGSELQVCGRHPSRPAHGSASCNERRVTRGLLRMTEKLLRAASIPRDFDCSRNLLELVGDLLDTSLRTGFIAGLIVATHADAADRVIADIDWVAAAERDHIGELPLTRILLARVGAVAPV